MKFLVNDVLNFIGENLTWVKHNVPYEADWTPGWPRHPRHVRLYSPSDRMLFVDLPITYLTRIDGP